jgi:hypothetical protein
LISLRACEIGGANKTALAFGAGTPFLLKETILGRFIDDAKAWRGALFQPFQRLAGALPYEATVYYSNSISFPGAAPGDDQEQAAGRPPDPSRSDNANDMELLKQRLAQHSGFCA